MITETQVFTELRAFLLEILPPPIEVVRAQVNRVPEVAGDDFVLMTARGRTRLATNIKTPQIVADEEDTATPTQLSVQLDVHGPKGAENAQRIVTLFRDDFACRFFQNVSPLYADDAQQLPFINGEKQFEDRWVLTVVFQVNLVVSTSQEFASSLDIDLIEVDTTFPA